MHMNHFFYIKTGSSIYAKQRVCNAQLYIKTIIFISKPVWLFMQIVQLFMPKNHHLWPFMRSVHILAIYTKYSYFGYLCKVFMFENYKSYVKLYARLFKQVYIIYLCIKKNIFIAKPVRLFMQSVHILAINSKQKLLQVVRTALYKFMLHIYV